MPKPRTPAQPLDEIDLQLLRALDRMGGHVLPNMNAFHHGPHPRRKPNGLLEWYERNSKLQKGKR